MKTVNDVNYSQSTEEKLLNIYLPECTDFDTVVFFHGGGLVEGTRNNNDLILPIVNKGVAVVSVEYRMLPKVHFPDFLYDAAESVAYVQKNIKSMGGNGKIFVNGDSAGAYITMMLCLDDKYYKAFGVDKDSISGYISNSAQQFAHFNLLTDRGFDGRIERIDETAPISFVKAGLEIKPLYIICYTNDMPCRPEENRLMYKSMKRFLPETGVLEFAELAGGHCDPVDKEDYINKVYEFIKR